MRRIGPVLLSLSCLALTASCTQPADVTKAKDIDSIQSEDTSGRGSPSGALPAIPDGPVAKVGDTPITAEAFHEIYDLKLQKYADRGREIPKTADRRYRKSITDRLIYQEILRQEAKKRGIEYDKDALTQRQESQKRGIKDWDKHLRRRGESEESLGELYIAELRERAILDAEGMLAVTDEEIQGEYEKVKPNYKKEKERIRAAHILVRVGPDKPPAAGEPIPEPTEEQKKEWEEAALAKAKDIHAKVTAEGADFEKLAMDLSEGPSARKGGDLGIFSADRMIEEFSDAAFALDPGQVSEPVKTKFGFHIIKVHGKYAPGDLPREALEDQIRERLSARKLHQGRRDLKERLMEEHDVNNIMEEVLGPDPRAERRKANRRRQGHPPGTKPGTKAGGPPAGGPPASGPPSTDPGAGEAAKAPEPTMPAPTGEQQPLGDLKPVDPATAKGNDGKANEAKADGGPAK